MADAYAVAEEVHQVWSALGHEQNGVKIGLSDSRRWPSLGIDGPIWARTYSDTTEVGVDAQVDGRAMLSPRIEAEIVVGLSRVLSPGAAAAEVTEAIAWTALGFEIVDCHVAQWRVRAADLVADFGAHAGLVVGERRELEAFDLGGLAGLDVALTNGSAVHRGRGKDVLGGPVPAIVALLGTSHAPVLPAGSLLCTGALTGTAHAATTVESWRLESVSGLLPPVSVTLSRSGAS